MNWMQTVRMAFKSILNNKVRSILTMLGIAAALLAAWSARAAIYDAIQFGEPGSEKVTGWRATAAKSSGAVWMSPPESFCPAPRPPGRAAASNSSSGSIRTGRTT